MDIVFLFIAVIPLLVALHKIEWGVWVFVFMIPGYALRVPLGIFGTELTVSMVEIAALLLMVVLFAQRVFLHNPAPRSPQTAKRRTGERTHGLLRRIALERLFGLLSRNKLFVTSTILFVAGLLISLSQSNDIFKSLGIIRGWVVVPIIFAALLWLLRRSVSLNKTLVGAFVLSGIFVALVSPFWENAFGGGRISGFYESPNYLAMYLAPLLPLIAWYTHRNWSNSIFRYVLLGGMGVVFTTVLFSFSRGAWIGLLAGGLVATVIFYHARIRKNWGVVLLGASLFCASSVALLLFTNFSGYLLNAFYSRSGIWEAALTMLSTSPLLGVGAGMFQTAFTVQKHLVSYPVPVEVALHPHNIFLATWLYGGIMGLVGFLGILFWIGKNLYVKITQKVGSDPTFYGALAVSFVIILVHGLVDTTYWKNDLAFMWWMLVVLVIREED